MPYLPDHLTQPDQWAGLAYLEVINLKETIMAQIDRLEELIKSEVGEALATMQQRVDTALANADASDAERAAVETEFETFRGRVDNLADRVQEEGLFGQDEEAPEDPGPAEPEPAPVTPEEPTLPDDTEGTTEPEPTEPGTEPGTEPPTTEPGGGQGTDPGSVTF